MYEPPKGQHYTGLWEAQTHALPGSRLEAGPGCHMPDVDGARVLGPQRPRNLLRHLPILDHHYLGCIGHAEEPTRLPF